MAGPDESWAGGGTGYASSSGASTSRAAAPAGDAEGASPDSLRNTASNIRRLQDAIGHCAARRKYLARTKSPSDGQEVRWYFCKLPLADKGAPSPCSRFRCIHLPHPRGRVCLTWKCFRFRVALQQLISGPTLTSCFRATHPWLMPMLTQ